ncbi:metallopeptidase family protein [Ruminococcaceae bacterium OttesenSCG-928-I18]|nr:metallopeptidase family protein [Ruminococcaceae bacterium OttesenSCG-928-I18]
MENKKTAMSFEEANRWLDEVADGIPEGIFKELNGGIVLLPDICISPHAHGGDLFTLGMYHYEPYGMGRYITIYYGSFVQVYGRRPLPEQKEGLKEVLYHELTHHIESLAGVRDLEVKDELFLEDYEKQRPKKKKR